MATIGKTFSDPDKWEEPWFLNLEKDSKYLFIYLWERCDHAGVIQYAPALFTAHTGLHVDEGYFNNFIKNVNVEAEIVLRMGHKLWFTGYIRFNQQNDPSLPLSNTYSFHKHVFRIIQKHGITQEVNRRDPILLTKFLECENDLSIEELISPKPSLSLSKELTKSTGRKAGKGEVIIEDKGSDSDVLAFEKKSKWDYKNTVFDYNVS